MLGLLQSTEVKRPLPKAQLFKRFDWTPSQRDRFDGEVSRLDFVNWISPRTVPAIAVGNEVKEIFVVEVSLKSRDFDTKNIALLGKSIPQHIVYLLRYDDEFRLAVYFTRLFTTQWQHAEGMSLQLDGLNLDAVWENIVRQIGNVGHRFAMLQMNATRHHKFNMPRACPYKLRFKQMRNELNLNAKSLRWSVR